MHCSRSVVEGPRPVHEPAVVLGEPSRAGEPIVRTGPERVLEDPEPQVVVAELGDSSINFKVRPWVKKEDYWGLYFDMQKAVKQRFDKEGISIPFPQRDVHLFQESAGG